MPLWLYIILGAIVIIYNVSVYAKNPELLKAHIKNAVVAILVCVLIFAVIGFAFNS